MQATLARVPSLTVGLAWLGLLGGCWRVWCLKPVSGFRRNRGGFANWPQPANSAPR